ncbi:TrkH family potassium uptake protein [Enterococcus nangangensis]
MSRFTYRLKIKSRLLANQVSPIQWIVSYYLILTGIAMIMFTWPIFLQPGVKIGLIDLFFLATSSVSVTGLTTLPLYEVFNERGIILLQLFFQVGGFGIMMISTFFFVLMRRKISLRQRQLIMTDMNQPNLAGTVRLIRISFLILLAIQFGFGFIFTIYLKLQGYAASWGAALKSGFFHAISSLTNAGFDVSGESMIPFAHDYFFLSCVMLLIFIGGIGFPVILEVRDYLAYRRKKIPHKLPYRFSLFTKIVWFSFWILFIAGTIIIYLIEKNHLFKDTNFFEGLFTSAFYSMSTRNAGMQINDLNVFQVITLIFFSALMFVGCSPSSVGGGVRTTTVAILALYLFSFIKSEDDVNIFGRRIPPDDIKKSVVVFNLSLLLCFLAVLFLSGTEDLPLVAIILEVASAFGTTGLSLGITGSLSVMGKIVIALLMLIGRIGMLYTLMLFVPKETQDLGYEYPSEKIIIG